MAPRGAAGIQADTLAPGLHFWLWPWLYDITFQPLFVLPHDNIGMAESCDGQALPDGRVIGRQVPCDNFWDARAFLEASGEREAQTSIVPQGQYRVNSRLFSVEMANVTDIPDNKVGIVTTKEGRTARKR